MTFTPAAFVELLLFLAITAALISLHSRWLDNTLAIIWLLVIAVGSTRLLYKRWTVPSGRQDSRGLPANGWSLVIAKGDALEARRKRPAGVQEVVSQCSRR